MIKEVQMEEKDVLEQEEKRAKLCIALNECVLESDFDRDSAHRKADILLTNLERSPLSFKQGMNRILCRRFSAVSRLFYAK